MASLVEKTKQPADSGIRINLVLVLLEAAAWALAFGFSLKAEGQAGPAVSLPALGAFIAAAAGLVIAVRCLWRRAEPFWLSVAAFILQGLFTALPVFVWLSGLKEVLG